MSNDTTIRNVESLLGQAAQLCTEFDKTQDDAENLRLINEMQAIVRSVILELSFLSEPVTLGEKGLLWSLVTQHSVHPLTKTMAGAIYDKLTKLWRPT